MHNTETRPTMMSWLKAAALRIREGNTTTLDNGKNELDVMLGCSTPTEVVNSIFECAVLGQTSKEVQASYKESFAQAVRQINETDPQQAQQILNEAKRLGQETPWLWYSANDVSHELNNGF